ncbi:hypothetical protein [Pseudonocardia kujensis]|uniref:hypothetical protein n=1 Tax=Pseudonocardia kujensis TaxID=1128675 RepID=UPI003556F7BD
MTLDPIEPKRRPSTSHQARLSMPYCLARIALDGVLDVASLAPEAVRDPRAAAFSDGSGSRSPRTRRPARYTPGCACGRPRARPSSASWCAVTTAARASWARRSSG